MTEILTVEQVEIIKLTLPLTPWIHSNRVTFYQLCASHEALRAQLAEVQQQLMNDCAGWALEMQEMEADLRARAEVLQMHSDHGHTFHGCTGCRSRRDNALARPGVAAVMKQEVMPPYDACSPLHKH